MTIVANLMLCSCVRTYSSPAIAYLMLASRFGLDVRPGEKWLHGAGDPQIGGNARLA